MDVQLSVDYCQIRREIISKTDDSFWFMKLLSKSAFIPTMPHDDGPEVMGVTQGTWYGKL